MNAFELGTKLVALCREGKNMEAIESFYADNVKSIEAMAPPQGEREASGLDAVKGKGQWWQENHEIHSCELKGPFPHGENKFAVYFDYDVTFKPASQRIKMEEVGVYTVENGKVVNEEFFYHMG